jgi:hypothetical protein
MRVAAAGMRIAAAGLCFGAMICIAHAEERWPEAACKNVQELEAFYEKNATDLTLKAWSTKPLLVLLRDHCGVEVQVKVEESDRIIKSERWPSHVCSALVGSKRLRAVLAKPLQAHCGEAVATKEKSSG